jgi:RsiW-degrading membrane proteinase PrsW (M82 family)
MSKFFLVVRIVVLLALFFLLAATFWGLANRESTQADDGVAEKYEEYQRSKPASYTSYLLIGLVVIGIFVVLASIFFEYHQLRRGTPLAAPLPTREEDEREPRWK